MKSIQTNTVQTLLAEPSEFVFLEDEIESLNLWYETLTVPERLQQLALGFGTRNILLTSSFGISSAILLHEVAAAGLNLPVHFIDTHYHFEETKSYRNQLSERLNLEVVNVYPEDWKHDMTRKSELWKTHPDLCCAVNKVDPVELLKKDFTVWISGLMGWQSSFRKQKRIFEYQDGFLKFYPLLEFTAEDTRNYLFDHDLPAHPLAAKGYGSVGCFQCTKKGEGRQGRWAGKDKLECGLHR